METGRFSHFFPLTRSIPPATAYTTMRGADRKHAPRIEPGAWFPPPPTLYKWEKGGNKNKSNRRADEWHMNVIQADSIPFMPLGRARIANRIQSMDVFIFFFLVRPTVHVRTNDDPNGKAKRLAEIKAFFFSLFCFQVLSVGRPSAPFIYLSGRKSGGGGCVLARASAGPRSIARVNDTRLTWSRRKHTAAIEDLRLNTYTTARTLEFRSQSKHAWISSLRRPFDGNRHSPFTPESTPQHFKQPDILRRITSLDGTHKKNKEGTTEEAAIKSEMDICFPSSIFWRREWERRSPRRHVEENDIKDKLRQTAGKASKIPRHYISQKHRRCFQTTWEKEKGDQQVQSASLKTFGLGKMARRWAAKLGVAPAVQYAWANKGNTHTRARVYNNNYQDQGPGNSTIQADCIIWSHPPAKYLPKSRRLQKFSVLSSARNGGHGNNNEFNPFSAQADH